jgi:hypothetical protein
MREPSLRQQLSHTLVHGENITTVKARIVNMMIHDIDSVKAEYWSHLGDMGFPRKEFEKIMKAVKRRIF